ncbi:MAG TPA: O-antigen ligase family protein [Methylomirabilota bacterium]|nr:O-antigen ligase family protein [Methylomirabilota bacterium]
MALLLLMIAIMPYEQSPYLYLGENLLGIFIDFTVIKLLGLLGFAWAGLRLASGDPMVRRLRAPQVTLFGLFLVAVTLLGIVHGTGFQYVIGRYIAYLTFLPFLVMAVRTQADLGRVLKALVISYAVVFPYAVRQMIRFGERLGVGIYEANYLATILVLLVPLAFVFASQQRVPKRRWAWIGAGLVLIVMIYLTGSRGGFVGLVAAGVSFVYRRRGFAAALAILLVLVASVLILPTELSTRALATLSGDTSQLPSELEASNRAHVGLFWAALRMISDNPFVGVGPLNFKDLSTAYTGLPEGNMAHNMFLEIAAEEGLPVFVLFLLLLGTTFRALGAAARLRGGAEANELAGWAEGLRCGLTGYVIGGCFISAEYEKILWITVFLSIVVAELARRHRAAMVEEPAVGAVEGIGGPLPMPS